MNTFGLIRLFFSMLLCLFISQITQSKTLIVPDEAASVQEAVEMAESGDEIILAASRVSFAKKVGVESFEFLDGNIRQWDIYDSKGIDIINKDLVFRSSDPDSFVVVDRFFSQNKINRVRIENSEVKFENIQILEPTNRYHYPRNRDSQWIINSGTLHLNNCQLISSFECKGNLFVKDCDIQGYSWVEEIPYTHYTGPAPAFTIGFAESITIQFSNSVVHGTSLVSYRSIDFNELSNSNISFVNCIVQAGSPYGYENTVPINGSSGMVFKKCYDNEITLNNTIVRGSNGISLAFMRFGFILGGGIGGDGIVFIESENKLNILSDTQFISGNGGDGVIARHEENHPFGPAKVIDGGDGGTGIKLVQSEIYLNNTTLPMEQISFGGDGGGIRILDVYDVERNEEEEKLFKEFYGAVDGNPGEPISLDEYSSIVQALNIQQWELYE